MKMKIRHVIFRSSMSSPLWRRYFSESTAERVSAKETPSSKRLDGRRSIRRRTDLRSPRQMLEELDRHIVGQKAAKEAVVVALRNRMRRRLVPEDLEKEITPRNILLTGTTGVGKSEIARRVAKISNAPFLKVEATKFTEVGFHGKDVDTIIKDLADRSHLLLQKLQLVRDQKKASEQAEEDILNALLGTHESTLSPPIRDKMRQLYRRNALDHVLIHIPGLAHDTYSSSSTTDATSKSDSTEEKIDSAINAVLSNLRNIVSHESPNHLSVGQARQALIRRSIKQSGQDINKTVVELTQEFGIVFIDEIDKVVRAPGMHKADASDVGVQRDLLPILEGTVIQTKYGPVKTDHILFIAAGAFHSVKPANMMAELQGRLPVRASLESLDENGLYRILTEPEHNLVKQSVELLQTEDIHLDFTEDGLRHIASTAFEMNRTVENTGARRLHSVLEEVLKEVSFAAPEMEPESVVTIDKQYVQDRVGKLTKTTDLSKYIL